jgi:hypothetical protein
MLQLNPAVPVWVPSRSQSGYAVLVTDYSQEHDRIWTVILADGTFWDLRQSEIRAQENLTLGRAAQPMV